jgi:hypothetical protein
MTQHRIEIQNWDMTTSVIPTHKMTEVAYKNWRRLHEGGGKVDQVFDLYWPGEHKIFRSRDDRKVQKGGYDPGRSRFEIA